MLRTGARLCAGVAIVFAIAATPASAATRFWDGGAADNNWMTAANWDNNTAPVAGDTLAFPAGVADLTTINNFPADTEFESLLFAADYTVSGNRVLVASTIALSTPGFVAINCEIKLKGAGLGMVNTVNVIVADEGTIAFNGAIGDTFDATFKKGGPGRIRLTAANTFNAGVWIQDGTARVTNASGLGTGASNTTVAAGATLVLALNGATTLAEWLILEGTNGGPVASVDIVTDMTQTGNIVLLGPAAPNINVYPNHTLIVTGTVSGPAGFTKNSLGTLRFEGAAANTYGGVAAVSGGVMVLARSAVSIPSGLTVGDGFSPDTDIVKLETSGQIEGAVAVRPLGWLDLGNVSDTIGALSMTGGKVSTGGLGQLTLGGNVTIAVSVATPALLEGRLSLGGTTRTFFTNGAGSLPPFTVDAVISGAPGIGLIKHGNAPLRLNGANTYTGPTTVAEGVLVAGHTQAFGAAAQGTTVLPTSTGIILGADVPSEPLFVSPGASNTTYPILACKDLSFCTWGGPILLGGKNAFSASDGRTLILSGNISGNGDLVAWGHGTVELGGSNNTYDGDTNPTENTVLRLTGSERIPDSSIVRFGPGGVLNLNGFSETVRGLSTFYSTGQVILGAGTLTVAPLQGDEFTLIAPISGSGGLVKKGAGSLYLKAAELYTGQTTVQAGTLALDGSLAGPVHVTGGIFQGIGHVGKLSSTGGRIAPGFSPGKLVTGELKVNAAATLSFEVDGAQPGTNYDQIDATGAVTLDDATLELIASPSLALSTLGDIVIISNDASDPVVGTFNGLPEGALVVSNDKPFHITYKGGDGNDVVLSPAVREYYLSEGATGFFDLDILIANPNGSGAPVTLTFLLPGGGTIVKKQTIPAMARATVRVNDIEGLQSTAVSTVVTSDLGLPLVVERTMRWDNSGYGAHTEKAAGGTAKHWYFAEGAQGFFSMYLLLANPQSTDNVATVTYLRENAAPVVRTYAIKAQSRFTVDAGTDSELVSYSFGMHVVFDQPGVAERSMYFGTNPLWQGGHESAGVTAPSTTWFLAEGATGAFFETFVLLANPSNQPAEATVTFLPSTGVPVTKTKTVEAFGRTTINIEGEDPALANAAVATQVTSNIPILVERAQYWPDPAWYEAHNSFGVTSTGTKWGLAEGRVGGPEQYSTFILIANPGNTAASVTITFLRENGAPFDKTFTVKPTSRFNVDVGPGTFVPEIESGNFGALLVSTQPVVVERAMYSNANGQLWAAGTNATATALP